jgi:MFS family permease
MRSGEDLMSAAPRKLSSFRALRTRNYRLWVSGTLVSNTGTWIQRTAQDWLVLTGLTHGSGLAVGVAIGLQFAPMLVLAGYSGVIVDRLPTRRILAVTQATMGLSALALGVLTLTHTVVLWHVFVCAGVLGVASALDNPARQALVSQVVPRQDVPSAVSLNTASMNVARLVGPGLSGLLIAAFGSGPSFLINAMSFLAVLVSLWRMRASEMFPAKRVARQSGQLREGFRYLRARPDLGLIFVLAGVVGTFGLNFQITNALMAHGAFHQGVQQYGLLNSTFAIGSLSAALLAARREAPRIGLLVGAATAFGVFLIVAAVMPSYRLYGLFLIPVGLAAITFLNSCNTAVQLTTHDGMRGRMLALYLAVQQGTTPIGGPIVGYIGTAAGARWSVLVGGVAALGAACAATVVLRTRPAIGQRFEAALHAETEVARLGDAVRV